MSKTKQYDDSWSVGNGYSIIDTQTYPGGDFLVGDVFTPYGIVAVDAQGDERQSLVSRLDFVWEGRTYRRTIYKRFTKIGLACSAHKFAREIARKK